MALDTTELIDLVTRRVMAELDAGTSAGAGRASGFVLGDRGQGDCAGCAGSCVMRCPERVASVVSSGAARLSSHGDASTTPRHLARLIDHTLLKPDATATEIDRLCDEARQYGFAAVCVNPTWVRRCADRLRGSEVDVASVVGFPLGASVPEMKAMEARRALRDGAREIDMVINIGALKSGDHDLVREDVARVSDACHEVRARNKVIIEAALLTDEEKVVAARLAKQARADFVKTSTGFASGGATAYDVALIREAVGPEMGIKAAGGIRTLADVEKMVAAGATRIGASAGVKIVTGATSPAVRATAADWKGNE
jgi:deoxyribose-phosphate aldolase